jgi:Ca-activated chloride channel homolog
LKHLENSRYDKKALIIVSDGGDNASKRKFAEILELARRSQAVIYAIGLLDAHEEENPGVLRRLCNDSGGLAFFPSEVKSVSDISAIIAHDLREQYTIGFSPGKKDDRTYRKVHVNVEAPERGRLKVRTRSGYSFGPKKDLATLGSEGSS